MNMRPDSDAIQYLKPRGHHHTQGHTRGHTCDENVRHTNGRVTHACDEKYENGHGHTVTTTRCDTHHTHHVKCKSVCRSVYADVIHSSLPEAIYLVPIATWQQVVRPLNIIKDGKIFAQPTLQ